MRPTRLWFQLEHVTRRDRARRRRRRRGECPDRRVQRTRRLPAHVAFNHPRPSPRHPPLLLLGNDRTNIRLVHAVPGKRPLHQPCHVPRLGQYERTRRGSVEPVHEKQRRTPVGAPVGAPVVQPADDGVSRVHLGTPVHRHRSRLVDHKQVLVLVEHGESPALFEGRFRRARATPVWLEGECPQSQPGFPAPATQGPHPGRRPRYAQHRDVRVIITIMAYAVYYRE